MRIFKEAVEQDGEFAHDGGSAVANPPEADKGLLASGELWQTRRAPLAGLPLSRRRCKSPASRRRRSFVTLYQCPKIMGLLQMVTEATERRFARGLELRCLRFLLFKNLFLTAGWH